MTMDNKVITQKKKLENWPSPPIVVPTAPLSMPHRSTPLWKRMYPASPH